MKSDEQWNPFEGLAEEVSGRPSKAWINHLNELLELMDSRWAEVGSGQRGETPLHLAAMSVILIHSALLRLKGIEAKMEPLQELVVALTNAIEGKRDKLIQPLAGHKEPGLRVRMLRGRAVLAVELLIDEGLSEPDALKLVARELGRLGIPAVSVRPNTVRDWRTNVKWDGSMPQEAAHYYAAKNDVAMIKSAIESSGLDPFRLNRKQFFQALFHGLAANERNFGV